MWVDIKGKVERLKIKRCKYENTDQLINEKVHSFTLLLEKQLDLRTYTYHLLF